MEDKRPDTSKQQSGRDAQSCDQGNENSCSEHGKHVLQSKQGHAGLAQNLGVVDSIVVSHNTYY